MTSASAGSDSSPVQPRRSLLRRVLFPIGMSAAVLGVFWLVAGHTLTRGNVEQLPPEPPRGSSDPNAVAVTVAPVVIRPVQRTVEVVGTLWGYEEVSLRAKVEGRVKRVVHDVSDRVEPGEPLIEIDPADSELAVRQAQKNLLTDLARLGLVEPPKADFDVRSVPIVAQAKVRLDYAKEKAERADLLAKRAAISVEEHTDRNTQFRAAEAELANQILIANAVLATIQMRQESLAIAEKQLADTVVRAPTPSNPLPEQGADVYAVTRRSVSEGTFVRVGDEVCRLVIDRTLKLRVAVPERYTAEVQLGQQADVMTQSLDAPVESIVTRINPAVDQATRTFEVEIQCDNREGKLKPGGFAKAAIATRLDERATTVPLEALVTFAGISKIFVTEGDQVREVQVKLGEQATDWVEISSPELPVDAQVVTSGQTVLAEGSTVFVRKPDVARRSSAQGAQ
jgi:RND family efflux transporter MFP subunit